MPAETLHEQLLIAVQQRAQQAGVTLPDSIAQANGNLIAIARSCGLEPSDIAECIADVTGHTYEPNLAQHVASVDFTQKIPIGFARQHRMIGLAGEDNALTVAIADTHCWPQLDVVSRYLDRPVQPIIARPDDIAAAINLAYQQQTGQADSLIESLDPQSVMDEIDALTKNDDLLDVASRAPVIKLVNLLLFEAIKQQASDIHFHPYEDRVIVRMRIDGVLFDANAVPKALQEEVISRIKVMGKMNIAERRLAQDGRATVQVGDRIIDLRIASLPTSFGERIVIRLLDKSARLYQLSELGMDGQTLEQFRQLITVEHGLVLVTGPTGSGKSTTLYAALQELDSKEKNILTLEDPIEYQLPGISQTQINERKGLTFASGLRNILRQDPDIIMVGEIRDHETAVMAIQSALTGHLVFATLHTNDSASAVTRLLDLGIEPYLAASSIVGVLAQRLVRRVCKHCALPEIPDQATLARLDIHKPTALYGSPQRGTGCKHCRNTGYRHRVGLFEMLIVDEPIRQLIQQHATASQLKSQAASTGMHTLLQSGVEKLFRGDTTAEEVLRVTMRATT